MKNKKFLLILMIIFTVAITFGNVSSTNIKSNSLECISTNNDQADIPLWSIGNFWEYDISINFAGMLSLDAIAVDVMVTDINDDENEYNLGISGYLDKIVLGGYDYSIFMDALYLEGNAHVNKSTLAIKEFTFTLSGNLQGALKIDFNIDMKMVFDPDLNFFDFPIIPGGGDLWNINNVINFTINGYVKWSGKEISTIDEKSLDNLVDDELSVIRKDFITVPAGNYESFLISGELGNPSELWYNSSVGNLVKVDQYLKKFLKFYIFIDFGCYLELLSTNYNHPDDNGAPNIPTISGPNTGKPRVEHEYMVSTNDPDGEQVFYKIDWGDGTITDWEGPYNSGIPASTSHIWTQRAFYKIRVKAKDINCYESPWSEPKPINIPKNKQLANPLLLRILEFFPKYLSNFKIFDKIIIYAGLIWGSF